MRADATHRLLLNAPLFREFSIEVSNEKYVRFTVIGNGSNPISYMLRVSRTCFSVSRGAHSAAVLIRPYHRRRATRRSRRTWCRPCATRSPHFRLALPRNRYMSINHFTSYLFQSR